jgi:hypothetical protein
MMYVLKPRNSVDSQKKEYTTILGHSKTRGLCLLPNAEGTTDLICALKAYLLSLEK